MSVNPPALITVELSKTFDTLDGPFQAVNGIDLVIKTGEFVCIVGPSGCGKTTLLQLLSGLMPVSSGEVFLSGRPLLKPSLDIGMVFQKPNLMPWRTVLDNVLLPAQIQGLSRKEAESRAAKALKLVGLTDFSRSYPKALSGGMEQRVALARSLMQNPSMILMDEPFGSLDALTKERMNKEMLKLWRRERLTAVMVTHDIREAVYLADRVIVLTPCPATISDVFTVDLPRPRPDGIEYSSEFGKMAQEIRQAIRE